MGSLNYVRIRMYLYECGNSITEKERKIKYFIRLQGNYLPEFFNKAVMAKIFKFIVNRLKVGFKRAL